MTRVNRSGTAGTYSLPNIGAGRLRNMQYVLSCARQSTPSQVNGIPTSDDSAASTCGAAEAPAGISAASRPASRHDTKTFFMETLHRANRAPGRSRGKVESRVDSARSGAQAQSDGCQAPGVFGTTLREIPLSSAS